MRLSAIHCLSIIASGIVGCSGSGAALIQSNTNALPGSFGGTTNASSNQGQGGVNNQGGATMGGVAANGGSREQGGGFSTGGDEAVGGVVAAGGKTSGVGGKTSGVGGSTSGVGGSTSGVGGSTSGVGGTVANVGGSVSTAGATAVNGGSSSSPTGGRVSTGGAVSMGGSVAVSTCTDTARSSESCSDAKSWGFCSQSWFSGYCQATCGTCSGVVPSGGGSVSTGGSPSAGGNSPAGGATSSSSTNTPITGDPGWASRYWDCCMPSCSWSTNLPWCDKNGTTKHTGSNGAKSGCEGGGNAFECYNFAPWYDSASNMSYGYVAHNQVPCGTCYEIQFTGDGHDGANPGAQAIKGKQMIVQVINIGGIGSDQFDLLVPGGGVGAMTEGCKAQWGSSADLGATFGGLYANSGGSCATMKSKCQSVFGSIPDALAGCLWFTDWYACADNPKLVYKKVSCPSQITSRSGISAH